jgi:hypothetical protein
LCNDEIPKFLRPEARGDLKHAGPCRAEPKVGVCCLPPSRSAPQLLPRGLPTQSRSPADSESDSIILPERGGSHRCTRRRTRAHALSGHRAADVDGHLHGAGAAR